MYEHLCGKSAKLINQNIIILISSIFSYIYSISGDFVFDDTEAILNNNDVIAETSLKRLFSNDFWGTNIRHNSSHKSYRPLTVLSFRIIRYLSFYFDNQNNSVLNPKLYHLINIVLYGFLCLFLLKVLNKLLNLFIVHKNDQILSKGSDGHVKSLETNRKTAFLTTLLFSVHPIHSESVSSLDNYLMISLKLDQLRKRSNYFDFIYKRYWRVLVWLISRHHSSALLLFSYTLN